MIYITQLIYINNNEEDIFHQFEELAIPLISKYNGCLLLRMRPKPQELIVVNIEPPHEVHLISFEQEADFDNFKLDEDRKQFLHLKERSVKSVLLIKGTEI